MSLSIKRGKYTENDFLKDLIITIKSLNNNNSLISLSSLYAYSCSIVLISGKIFEEFLNNCTITTLYNNFWLYVKYISDCCW